MARLRQMASVMMVAAGVNHPANAMGQEAEACPDGRIADVIIDNSSVFDLTETSETGRFVWAYRLANRLHLRTRREVIDRELLFQVGDCYDVEFLRDSERLLRGFGFIARAEIYGVRQDDDRVQVIVNTQDEWSTRVEVRVGSNGGLELRGLRLVEDNLAGTGQQISLFFDRRDDERMFGAGFATPQLLGTRTNMALQVARTEVGYSLHESVTYPFVGEIGKWAFRQQLDRRLRYFELLTNGGSDAASRVWVPVRREQVEVGGAFRWGGRRYRHSIVAATLAGERIGYPGMPIYPDSIGRPEVPTDRLPDAWNEISTMRLMLLTGRRAVRFVRARALDTVHGTEDLQLGLEGEVAIGPTLPLLSNDQDVATSGRIAFAAQPRTGLVIGGQVWTEGRRDIGQRPEPAQWHDVLGEIDLWTYLRSASDSTQHIVAALSAVGGWNTRVPFQLTLGGDAGLRGYPRHVEAGGRRIVASIEHRSYLGWPLPELFDLGSVVFADAGKVWPGDAPFAVKSPLRATVGIGLRAAFPPGSRQTFRADLGIPLQKETGIRGVVVSIGVGQMIGRHVMHRDPQLLRSARYGLSSAQFLARGAP